MRKKKEIELHDKSYKNEGWNFDERTDKDYVYKIVFKNNYEMTGSFTCKNLDEIVETVLRNKYTYCNDDTRVIYYNSNEILYFEAEEKVNGM